MPVGPEDDPLAARELECTICWMSEESRILVGDTRSSTQPGLSGLPFRRSMNEPIPETLERQLEPTGLGLNDIGRVTLRTELGFGNPRIPTPRIV